MKEMKCLKLVNPSRPDPGQGENNLNFYFHASLWCIKRFYEGLQLFHDGGRYHIETSPFICSANQWTSLCMITASVMKGLRPS